MTNGYLCYASFVPPWREALRKLRRGKPSLFVKDTLRKLRYDLGGSLSRGPSPEILTDHMRFSGGIAHITNNLECLLKEALYLGRTAVVFPLEPDPVHNFGKAVNPSVSDYYDLSASYAVTNAAGPVREDWWNYSFPVSHLTENKSARKKLDYIPMRDFPAKVGSFQPYFVPQTQEITAQQNKKHPLIVRYLHPPVRATYQIKTKPLFCDFYRRTELYLQTAAPLVTIARETIAKLGHYHFLSCRLPWDDHRKFDKADAERMIAKWNPKYYPVLRHFLSGEDLCRQLVKKFPPGAGLYVASNLWKPNDADYFAPLRKTYRVSRCYDFPRLAAMADPTGQNPTPNTAGLYLIENMIKSRASKKLSVHFLDGTKFDKSLAEV